MKSRSVAHLKVQFAFGAAILALIAVGTISYRAVIASSESDRWVQHTYEVLANLNEVLAATDSLESGYRGFALTGDESALQSYQSSIGNASLAEKTVRDLTVDNSVQQQRLPALDQLIARKIQFGDSVIVIRRTEGLAAASDALRSGTGLRLMIQIQSQVRAMQDEELRLLALRNSDAAMRTNQTKTVLILGTALGVLIAMGAGWFDRRRNLAREQAESKVESLSTRLSMATEAANLGVWEWDPVTNVVICNETMDKIYGYSPIVSTPAGSWLIQSRYERFVAAIHPEDKAEVEAKLQQVIAKKSQGANEHRVILPDGSIRIISAVERAILDEAGKVIRLVGVSTDITDRQAAEDELFAEKERAQVTLSSIGDAVACTDLAGNVSFLNPVAEKMTGWSQQDAAGRPMAEILRIQHDTTREPIPNPMELAMVENLTMNLPSSCHLVRRDGKETPIEDSVSPIHDRRGQVTGAVIVFRDVTAAQAMARQMAYSAQHDFLTGLPNRILLNDRVSQAIAASLRHQTGVAVLFLDLDGFKHINDSLGHPIGDRLLQSIAARLRDCLRGSDTVSRQGGDEFVMLLPEIQRAEEAAVTAQRVIQAIDTPHSIDDHDLHITASIGISVYPDDGLDSATLIKNADTAMYHAKEHGRKSYEFFKPDMNIRAVARQSIEEGLRRALEQQEFVVHYQPKVDLRSGAITGAEALLRWAHPTRGMIAPAEFIPVAEDCGLIVPIDNWVLRESCRQARAWLDAELRLRTMSVNVSAMEFRDKHFGEVVLKALDEAGLHPCYLQLELTESILMRSADSTESILDALKATGVQVAIDDFGTGYSSLSYLTRFPIDTLKIDQSFVHQIAASESDTSIVTAIISMGHSLHMRVVAEGVETQEEAAFLRAQNCDEAQGYYFSRPVDAEQFAVLLRTGLSPGISTGITAGLSKEAALTQRLPTKSLTV
jgi:diguanylate cyclase (GGDEF)-like protein/PAS domain S-box-containing protein